MATPISAFARRESFKNFRMSIHPSSIVADGAQIGVDVEIGPFAIIENDVVVGDRCRIEASAQIRSGTQIGTDCEIGSGAIIGGDPQFRGFDATQKTGTRIGSRNVIRENSTIHRSIYSENATILGDDNYLMVGSHLGHDCIVGNHNTFANNVALGGHVTLGNHAFLGGGCMFHQFVRIGDYVMCQGYSGVSQDLPPYVMTASGLNRIAALNSVGMKRAGFSNEARKEIRAAFTALYRGKESLTEILADYDPANTGEEARVFYEFLIAESKKGICRRVRKDTA